MSRRAKGFGQCWSRLYRARRRLRRYLFGGVAFAALYLVGYGLLSHHTEQRTIAPGPTGFPVSYRLIPALLEQARSHDPLLRLPHARWFIRLRHGHVKVIVIDRAPLHASGSVSGTGAER